MQFPLLASIPLRENKGGHVRALTDLEGNITDTFSYDSFGNLLHPSSLILPTSYLYRGERYDPDLGQYYLRARFYDSDLGRFHTLDEYEGRTGEPLSLHKYLYAHANPVTGRDPSGRMFLAEAMVANSLFQSLVDMGGMGSGCSKCGPDVTEQLAAVIKKIRQDFYDLTDYKRFSLCDAAIHFIHAWDAWDIIELEGNGGWNTSLNRRDLGCAQGRCEGSVEVDGNCVGTSRANYIMWGTIGDLCGLSEWVTLTGARISKGFKENGYDHDTEEYTKLGYYGWPSWPGLKIADPSSGFFSGCSTGCGKYNGSSPWRYRWYPVFGD